MDQRPLNARAVALALEKKSKVRFVTPRMATASVVFLAAAVFWLAAPLPAAMAHSPAIVADSKSALTQADPFVITDPEHSQALFAELAGAPHHYKLVSAVPFRFYVGITAAKIDDCALGQTFSFDVFDPNGVRIDGRPGDEFDWWPWYEEFGKMWYWVGPEIGENFKSTTVYPAGSYVIRVSNTTNSGRYILAVGDEEQFGVRTIFRLLVGDLMDRIRQGWWTHPDDCQPDSAGHGN